jgi:hypothetical protein
VNTGDTATGFTGIELAQRDVELARADVTLVGPMYQFPLQADGIHLTNAGRAYQGDLNATVKAYEESSGLRFRPLDCTGAVLAGSVVTLTFRLPPETTTLAFDNDFVGAVANRGLVYVDSTTSATVTGVTISSPTTLAVQLSGVPTGTGKAIRCALWSDNVADGWASGRSTICAQTSHRSFAKAQGFTCPDFVRHYSLRFEQAIT